MYIPVNMEQTKTEPRLFSSNENIQLILYILHVYLRNFFWNSFHIWVHFCPYQDLFVKIWRSVKTWRQFILKHILCCAQTTHTKSSKGQWADILQDFLAGISFIWLTIITDLVHLATVTLEVKVIVNNTKLFSLKVTKDKWSMKEISTWTPKHKLISQNFCSSLCLFYKISEMSFNKL